MVIKSFYLHKNKEHFKFLPRLDKSRLNIELSQADTITYLFRNVEGWYPVKLLSIMQLENPYY